MIKKLFFLPVILFICAAMDVVHNSSPASNASPASSTGAPGEVDCTTSGCHQTYSVNSGPGSISITPDVSLINYTPGQTYTLSIEVDQAALIRFGFQTVALRNIDNTCYLAANNNNTNDSGDETYWKKITITPSNIGIANINGNNPNFSISPIPANEFINLTFVLNGSAVIKTDLMNIEGKIIQGLIQEQVIHGSFNQKILFNEAIRSGIYFVRSNIDGKESLKKIVIEK